jgi:predicted RNA-binding Zn-ribbon protein involved in translation (DUF1610 family)
MKFFASILLLLLGLAHVLAIDPPPLPPKPTNKNDVAHREDWEQLWALITWLRLVPALDNAGKHLTTGKKNVFVHCKGCGNICKTEASKMRQKSYTGKCDQCLYVAALITTVA